MLLTKPAIRFAVIEFSAVFAAMFLWTVSTGSWESPRYALLGMFILAIYSLLSVPVTMAFAAAGRFTRHRFGKWLCIPVSLYLWLLVVLRLESEILFVVLTPSAIFGIWVGMSKRWSSKFQSDILSVGMSALGVVIILSALHAIIVMQPFPTVILTYSLCIGIVAAMFTAVASHVAWQFSVGTFSVALGLLLLREPFLPFSLVGLSPLPEHPYIQSRDPIKLILFVVGIAVGIANGRHGYFHSTSSANLKRLFVGGAFAFAMCNLLAWEYSATDGVHEITTFLGVVWLFALVSVPEGERRDDLLRCAANNGMQLTALRAAADARRSPEREAKHG